MPRTTSYFRLVLERARTLAAPYPRLAGPRLVIRQAHLNHGLDMRDLADLGNLPLHPWLVKGNSLKIKKLAATASTTLAARSTSPSTDSAARRVPPPPPRPNKRKVDDYSDSFFKGSMLPEKRLRCVPSSSSSSSPSPTHHPSPDASRPLTACRSASRSLTPLPLSLSLMCAGSPSRATFASPPRTTTARRRPRSSSTRRRPRRPTRPRASSSRLLSTALLLTSMPHVPQDRLGRRGRQARGRQGPLQQAVRRPPFPLSARLHAREC